MLRLISGAVLRSGRGRLLVLTGIAAVGLGVVTAEVGAHRHRRWSHPAPVRVPGGSGGSTNGHWVIPGTGRMLVQTRRGLALIGRHGERRCPFRLLGTVNPLDVRHAFSDKGALAVSWVHAYPHQNDVSLVTATPHGCFGRPRNFHLPGRDTAILHMAIGDGGTLAVVFRRRGERVTYSAGPIGGRLRRVGDLGAIRDADPTMIRGDRIVFAYATRRSVEGQLSSRERVWTVRTAPRGGRLGRRHLLLRRRHDSDFLAGVATQDVLVLTDHRGGQVLAWRDRRSNGLRLAARQPGDRLGRPRTISDVRFGHDVTASIGGRGDALIAWVEPYFPHEGLYALMRRRGGRIDYRRVAPLLADAPDPFYSLAVSDRGRGAIVWSNQTSERTAAAMIGAAVTGPGGRLRRSEHIASRGVGFDSWPSVAPVQGGGFEAVWSRLRADGTTLLERSRRR